MTSVHQAAEKCAAFEVRLCDSPSCWCRRWPERWIPSTGARYTMDELPPEGRPKGGDLSELPEDLRVREFSQ